MIKKGESAKSRFQRFLFNIYPAYRGTGAKVTYISSDYKHIQIKIPLNRKTRNYVGTIFGGSMFAAVDPIYMVMFINLLGSGYIVWDKAASIQYRQPGKKTLFAEFTVDDSELEIIKNKLLKTEKIDRQYKVEIRDSENKLVAVIDQTLHFRKKS